MKQEILNTYYEKARIIQQIKKSIPHKNLHPTFKTEFDTDNITIKEILTSKEIRDNIVM